MKERFIGLIKYLIRNMSGTKQLETLENMQVWLSDFLAKKKKNYTKCSKCGKYSLTSSFSSVSSKEIHNEIFYNDSGYTDDDNIRGDVEYMVTYLVCPICKHSNESCKMKISVLSKYDKYGNKLT